MYTEGFEQWLKTVNKNFSSPAGDWNKAGTEMWRHMMRENLEIISDNLQLLSEQVRRFAHIKKPEDCMNVMRECLNEDINVILENSQRLMHSTLEHMEDYAKSSANLHEATLKTATKEREREREK